METLNTFNILSITAVVLIYSWMKYKLNYWQRQGILVSDKGPIKNSLRIILAQDSAAERGLQYYRYFKGKKVKHGGLYIMLTPIYIPVDVNLIKSIMQVDFQHFMDRGVYMNEKDDPLSAHLFSLTGNKWKLLRHKLSPTFTSGKMKMMFENLVNCTESLYKVMDQMDRKELDIKDVLGRFTTDIIGSCAFGIECNSLQETTSLFRQRGKQFFESDFITDFKIFLSFALPEVVQAFNMVITPKEISDFFMNVVRETIEYREKNNVDRKDFMHLLIQLKNEGQLVDDESVKVEKLNEQDNKITIEEIAAQAFIFFQAGFETSSTTMAFCLYELARNKHIQKKLRKEIVEVMKKYDGKITYDAVNEMTYLDNTINETFRKYPPVPNLCRKCTRDYDVPGTDLVIEKGVKLLIPVIGLHHDPEYYPEPDRFDPDRFTEENKKTRPAFTFMPFGEGPRICIGVRFGMMQTKVGLIALLAKYDFSVNNKTKEPLQFEKRPLVLSAEGGIWLDFEKIAE